MFFYRGSLLYILIRVKRSVNVKSFGAKTLLPLPAKNLESPAVTARVAASSSIGHGRGPESEIRYLKSLRAGSGDHVIGTSCAYEGLDVAELVLCTRQQVQHHPELGLGNGNKEPRPASINRGRWSFGYPS